MSRRNRRSLIGRNPNRAGDPNENPEDLEEGADDLEASDDDEGRDGDEESGSDDDGADDASESKEPGEDDATSIPPYEEGAWDPPVPPRPSDEDAGDDEPVEPPPAPPTEEAGTPATQVAEESADGEEGDPTIAPPMMVEDTVRAPETSRDLAAVEKAPDAEDLFIEKKIETANPAPERAAAGDAFPKDFEDDDDWFMKTGQPAPPRVEEAPAEGTERLAKPPSSWPLVLGMLAVAGVIGVVGVILVLLLT